jgi:oxygen-independent coproporphyrinogen-3 oxidase
MEQIEHIYVHIPFCSGKCAYCSFYSVSYNKAQADNFLQALQTEVGATASQYAIRPKTIYIGGGTPSLLDAPQLKRFLKLLRTSFDLGDLTEFSIEANPGTLPPEKLAVLAKSGVNRISIGAQSMDDAVLSLMARRHTATDTRRTIEEVRAAGFDNIGLDLIACLPGVDSAKWKQTLEETIALEPRHLSVYALSADPGSALHAMQQRQQWQPTGTEQEQAAIASAVSSLTAAGYRRYEISNYAHPGYHCRHNTAVWEGADYIGFGPAASSRIGLKRRTNTPELASYCSFPGKRPTPPRDEETVSPETDAAERFIFTFRLGSGVNPAAFAEQHGSAAQRLLPGWLGELASLADEGLVTQIDTTWALTREGINFADTVAERLLP